MPLRVGLGGVWRPEGVSLLIPLFGSAIDTYQTRFVIPSPRSVNQANRPRNRRLHGQPHNLALDVLVHVRLSSGRRSYLVHCLS
ncbi:hypothetical protein BDV12DRAFT_94099 [Aspergillus spectabilis]